MNQTTDPFTIAWNMANGRKLYHAYEFAYDLSTGKFWNVANMIPHRYPRSVDASVPLREWKKCPVRGTPIKPSEWVCRSENGCAYEGTVCVPGGSRVVEDEHGRRMLNVCCYRKGKA